MKKLVAISICFVAITASAGLVRDLVYSATNVVVGCACVVGNVVSGAFAGVTGGDQAVMDYVQEPLYNRNVDPVLYHSPVVIYNDNSTVNNTYIYVVKRGCRPPYLCGRHYLIGNRYIPMEQVSIIYE